MLLLDRFVFAGGVVADGRVAIHEAHVRTHDGARHAQANHEDIVHHEAHGGAQELFERHWVGHGDVGLAAAGDGLEPLAAHHRAHARARRGAAVVVHHRGVLDQVLAGQADGGHVDALLAPLPARP